MPIIRGKKSVPQATKRREDEMFEKIKMASATFTVQQPSVSIISSDDSDDDEEMRQNSLKVFLFLIYNSFLKNKFLIYSVTKESLNKQWIYLYKR